MATRGGLGGWVSSGQVQAKPSLPGSGPISASSGRFACTQQGARVAALAASL